MRKIIIGLSILTTVTCSSQNTFQVILDYPPAYSGVKKNYNMRPGEDQYGESGEDLLSSADACV